jgi:CheY-like chemotaxis protein
MARILLIDDDAVARGMLKKLLEDAGHHVQEGADGAVGMKLFREDPADVVITDIVMPEKEGIETIIELRREFPDVKIIAVSGGGDRLSSDSCLRTAEVAGASRILAKPLNVSDLLSSVDELLALSSACEKTV